MSKAKSGYWLMCGCLALGMIVPVRGEDESAVTDVAKSLEQISADVQNILVQDKINDQFDLFRRLREYGVTYQQTLTAPNNLAASLDDEKMRLYAGVKLFDAIYAATFMQRQAVSDCVSVMEEIQNKLDLRSYADLSGSFFETLKKAAADPQLVDVQALLAQLSADYTRDVPAMMSSTESADYLIDGLYGFTIQFAYVLGYFYQINRDDPEHRLREGMKLVPGGSTAWLDTMVSLFEAFDRLDETIRVSGETTEKLAVIRKMVSAIKARNAGEMDQATARASWQDISAQVAAIRASILTPSVE